MKIEFIQTRNIYHFGPILKPLSKDFGIIFYSTVFDWCYVTRDNWPKYWEFYLVQIDGMPSGCCGLYSLNNSTEELWLAWFGLLPELRNKGIGVKMLNFLEEEAKKVNCKKIFSYVDKEGRPLAFYTKNSFEVIGTVGEYMQKNNLSHIDGDEFEDDEDFVIQKLL